MDKPLLQLYAKRLAEENADDVCAALKAFEEIPRKEGESALPDIGTILGAVEIQHKVRLARENMAAGEHWVHWRCPVCHVTMSGLLKPGASRRRYCQGIPRKAHYAPGEVCGGSMDIIDDYPAEMASQGKRPAEAAV